MTPSLFFVLAVSLLSVSSAAVADVVWPALYLETRMFSWWAIGVGIVAEYLFVRCLFKQSIQRSVVATVAANSVSSVVGVLLVPVAGLLWEIFPSLIYTHFFKWGTFNPITWAATFVLACLVNTVIETLVYKKVFGFRVRRQEFVWIFVANAISVGLAFITLVVVPVVS